MALTTGGIVGVAKEGGEEGVYDKTYHNKCSDVNKEFCGDTAHAYALINTRIKYRAQPPTRDIAKAAITSSSLRLRVLLLEL